MAKIVICVAIVFFTTFLGWFLSGKYRKKANYFMDLYDLNDRYISELTYQRRPLPIFLQTLPHKRELYEDVTSVLENKSVSLQQFLSEEERTFCEQYISFLGKGDSFSQKSFFSSQKEIITRYEKANTENAKKQTELYYKLGFLIGLALIVLLV